MLPLVTAAFRWTQTACRRAKGCRVQVRIAYRTTLLKQTLCGGKQSTYYLIVESCWSLSKPDHWTFWIWSRSHRAMPEISFVSSVCVWLNWLLWRPKRAIPKELFPEYPSKVAGNCGSQQILLSVFSSVPNICAILILKEIMWPSNPTSSMLQAAHGRLFAEPLFTWFRPQFKKGLCVIENPLQLQKSVQHHIC